MFLGLDTGEALGVAFGAFVVTLSLWLLYRWAIKPDREIRKQNNWRAIEEMHRSHWERLRRRDLPSKRLCVFCVVSWWVLFNPTSVEAQKRGATLNTSVSETVILTIPINSSYGDVDMDVGGSGSRVRMALSGNGPKLEVIRVPLLVRSNVAFRISASAESKAALLTQLSVIDVRATGKLVSPEAISNLDIPQRFDRRGRKDKDSSEKNLSTLDVSQPFLLLSGPRLSLGGTLESPNNALRVTVLIRIKASPTRRWRVHLTFFSLPLRPQI